MADKKKSSKNKPEEKKLVWSNKYKVTRIDKTTLSMHSINRSYLRVRDYIKDLHPGDIVVEKIYLKPDDTVEIIYERGEIDNG